MAASIKTIKITFRRRSQPTHSLLAETIANNDDLLNQILLHLPIKSLLKFKSVSKKWLSLISDPRFARCLKPHAISPCALIIDKFSQKPNPEFDFLSLDSTHSTAPFKSLTFFNDPCAIKIRQSCNGLLLCCSFRMNMSNRKYYIYNPTTKQYTVLPPLRAANRVSGLTLAFDPLKSPHYKVVCVRKSESLRRHYQIDVYTSNKGPWRIASNTSPFTITGYIEFEAGVFCNGAIHWLSNFGESLYYNVDQQKLEKMPAPPIPDGWDQRRAIYFGESLGHLYLVEIYNPPSKLFNVLEMGRDYSGWTVKCRVDLDQVVSSFPEMIRSYIDPSSLNYYVFQIFCVCRGENDEDSCLVLHIPGKMVKYNLKDGTFQKLCDFAEDFRHSEIEYASNFILCNAYRYIESLAPV